MSEQENERTIWDINPLRTKVELTEGNIRIREQAIYNGQIRVSQAVNTSVGENECAWVYITAESRDGADLKLTPENVRELRDALDTCLERYEEQE